MDLNTLEQRIRQARGMEAADLVLKNADLFSLSTGSMLHGDIAICADQIVGVAEHYHGKEELNASGLVAVPGFIDAHMHVESSLLTPYEFERMVLPHGVTSAICDPHELANVFGCCAIDYFLQSARQMIMSLFVQIPSCVPATKFETGGAVLGAAELAGYRQQSGSLGLAEMMNVPGLLNCDHEVLTKLALFSDQEIDGHAPLLSGRDLNACLAAGIRNCHESSRLQEAKEKIERGMTLLIREGSVARTLELFAPLLTVANSPYCAFCTDDRNPLDIGEFGHIDGMVRRALALGCNPLAVYRASSWSAARCFGLRDRGLLAPGYRADVVLLSDFEKCRIESVIAGGRLVGREIFQKRLPAPSVRLFENSIHIAPKHATNFRLTKQRESTPVIQLEHGSLITRRMNYPLPFENGETLSLPQKDILKVAVLARHGHNHNIGIGFVKGFGLKQGALASSIGHDCHNLCVVGVSDEAMAEAVNALIECGGGFAVNDGKGKNELLPLPVGGLMSDKPFTQIAEQMLQIETAAQRCGCSLPDPFQVLAFLPLPVIPHLRITDRGIFDVDLFQLSD